MKKLLLLLSLLFLVGCSSTIENLPNKPEKGVFIQDSAGILSNATIKEINNIGTKVLDKTKVNFTILTIDSLNNNSVEDYTSHLFDKWKMNDQDILLVVAYSEHKLRIQTGSEAREILTDNKSQYVLDSIITPEFKKENYNYGVLNAYYNIIELIAYANILNPNIFIDTSILVQTKQLPNGNNSHSGWFWIILIFIAIVLFIILLSAISGSSSGSGESSNTTFFDSGSCGGGASGDW